MPPDRWSAGRFPRAEDLERDLKTLLKPNDAQEDGSHLLPPYASAEPGALLHEMHEVWTRQGGRGDNAHSFAKLQEACRINSLQHKLKGRLPMEGKGGREDARSLSKAMLEKWSADGQAFMELNAAAVNAAAGRLAEVLFGPIYGLGRNEIRIVESPGMNAATFMKEQRALEGALAIVIPVTDRAMFGPDPADTLDGTRLSVAQYLGAGDDPKPPPMIIYALRSEPPNVTKDYVRYIYERSFLSTLFRLVQQTSEKGWKVKHVGKQFPAWGDLERQLWVCVSPADRRADDIIPVRVPENWKDVVEGEIGPGGEFGLTIVCRGSRFREPAKVTDMTLEYWKYSKKDRAFSEIGRPADKHVEEAYRALIKAVFDVAGPVGAGDNGLSKGACESEGTCETRRVVKEVEGEDVSWREWTIASAEAFMRDRDLMVGGAKPAGSGG